MARRSYTSQAAGQNPDAPKLDFDLDGITWVCDGDISVLDLSEYARLAQQGVDTDTPEGMAMLADMYSGLLGDRYQAFRAHCRKHKTRGEMLVAIIGDLITEGADRPTSRPSDSSDGPTNGAATAKVVSLQRGTVEQVEAPILQETETVPTPAVVSYG
jgi:hypothetical protein